ncbi:predicted protein [Naegleria gruberi]|uniref:Predicted protein n=1 Tax=Naegleria gruberi TaxID=5762 RepID=D2W311_NAEGR|nr:uncharacterized protein NAEGRDRAFT_82194 [Naegleria gruberi]EFC36530.1 predicted protein [Naegleria gruberi]|eukprot:XP_002669274.1 predicted protein [Naegleria gruberi strain NEG-M]
MTKKRSAEEEQQEEATSLEFDEEDDRPMEPLSSNQDEQQEHLEAPSENQHDEHEERDPIDEEEDFLLNGDIMDTPSVASAFSDESEATQHDATKQASDFAMDYLLSLRYILERERALKKKKQIIGKVHKIIWKRYHEPNYPQHLSTAGENQSHFIHLVMDEIATEEDIIRITRQFGPILLGLEIRNCLKRKVKKNPPKKKRKTKKEEETVAVVEEEDFSHPVLSSIVKNCPKLEILKIDGNSFTTEEVQFNNVLSLPNLKTYHGPVAQPKDSKTISNRLRKVKIESDKITPTMLKFISNNSERHFRTLLTNAETSLTLKSLQDLSEDCDLTKISLKHVKFISSSKDSLSSHLGEFGSLKTLELFNENSIESNGFKKLGSLKNLTHLNLTRCDNLDDMALSTILRKCKSVKKLILDNCWQVSEESLKEISNLSDLYHLDTTGLRITNKVLKVIADSVSSNEKFTHFICESNYNATDEGLQILLEKFPSLKYLNLNRWEKLTDVSLENIGKYLKCPKKLGLIQGFKSKARYTSQGLRKALTSKSVTCLTLQSVDDINQAMTVLSESTPLLEELSVSGNENLNDDAVEILCEGCKYLRVIDFSQCSLLSDEALNAVSILKNLREINIVECEEVTCDGIEVMLDACNYVSRVNIKPDFAYIEKTKHLFLEHSIRYEKDVTIQIR